MKARQGSALLLTLLVVSLLVMLVLAFTVRVRMELRNVINHQHGLQAKANARLGAELGIARLQELLGPDTRVTARGDLLRQGADNVSGLQLPAAKLPLPGVWDSLAFAETSPGTHAQGAFLGWLVSGMTGGLLDPLPADAELLFGPATVAPEQSQIRGGRIRWDQDRQGYAWAVDDLGLKATLAAGEDATIIPPPGGGVIPGTLHPRGIRPLAGQAGLTLDDTRKLSSLRELPLIGAEEQIVREHFQDYTTVSLGVLSNNRSGGLRRDLTLAFENNTVFDRVFPVNNVQRYLLVPSDKLDLTADLRENGYIHWNIFRDYYNLKRHIVRFDDQDVLDANYYAKENIISGTNNASRGLLAPHAMGADTMPAFHSQQPYGDLAVRTGQRVTPAYKHNPIAPIMSLMHQKAWLDYVPPAEPGGNATLTTRLQLWSGHYNPYNISMRVIGDGQGPRLHNYPQVFFNVPGVTGAFSNLPGRAAMTGIRESNSTQRGLLGPGQSQIYGLERDGPSGDLHNVGLFGPNIRDNITANVSNTYNVGAINTPDINVRVTFRIERQGSFAVTHGANMHPPDPIDGDMEVSQFLLLPYAWDSSLNGGLPSKVMVRQVPVAELNELTYFSAGFYLRTTRESPSDAIRPIVDANIRATWVNPRWDASLPVTLSTAAAYSNSARGELAGPFPQMLPGPGGRTGYSYMGADTSPPRGTSRVILFDIPREDLVSLGQMQHASAGRFSYEPSYIVGNSYANPRLGLSDWRRSITDTFSPRVGLSTAISGSFNLYDASYLVNQVLWDDYVFTTIPQVRDNHTPGEPPIDFPRLLTRADLLPNPRFLPHEPRGFAFTASNLQAAGDTEGTQGSFFHNAGFLMVNGVFNVNSTSVDAWEAFLMSTLDTPVQRISSAGIVTGYEHITGGRVRFPRVKAVFGNGMDRETPDENYWTGFRELRAEEVRALAEAIVRQVRRRGPFLSLGQFVNRMLINNELGHAGALQAALDATVNKDLHDNYERAADGVPGISTQGAGFPGQLLQGDLLQAMAPLMSVRSDTFTVRAHGEWRPPGSASATARAWCEVIVQRIPDPVASGQGAAPTLAELANPSGPFGRQFKILSFRWLNEDEI